MAKVTPAAKSTSAKRKPVIDDVEDLLNVASDERDLIWLSRLGGSTGWELLETLSPAAMREPGITVWTQQKYGGGRFRARIRQRNGAWGHSRQFSIAGEMKMPAAAAAPAATAPSTSSGHEMPSWLEKIVLPVAVTLAAGLANKLLADPKTDPLVLELLKQRGRGGDGVDPMQLTQMLAQAEARGRELGRELGELTAEREQPRRSSGESSSGTVTAIREATGLVQTLIASRRAGRGEKRRVIPPAGSVSPAAPSLPASGELPPPVPTNAAPDIVPAWMRPFMPFRGMLVHAADTVASAQPIAGLIMQNADDPTWAAIIEADTARRLESDLLAAVPELAQHERRQAFVKELVEVLHAEIVDPSDGEDDEEHEGDEQTTPAVEEA